MSSFSLAQNVASNPRSPWRIPIVPKVIYSAFVAVMLPYYWHACGPQNFLYFCDVAVLITLVGIWTESPLLISCEAVAILLPQAIWLLDVAVRLVGFRLPGLTDYMFDPAIPSSFAGFLPFTDGCLFCSSGCYPESGTTVARFGCRRSSVSPCC